MKKASYIAVLLVSLAAFQVSGQDTTQRQHWPAGLFSKADSLQLKLVNWADTLSPRQKLSKGKADSLRIQTLAKATKRVDSLQTLLAKRERLQRVSLEVDSLHRHFTGKLDSLHRVPNPNMALAKALDSVRTGLDSLRADLQGELNQALGRGTAAAEKMQKKLGNWQAKANRALAPFNENGAGMGSVNIPSLNLPSSGLSLPQVNLPSTIPDLGSGIGDLSAAPGVAGRSYRTNPGP